MLTLTTRHCCIAAVILFSVVWLYCSSKTLYDSDCPILCDLNGALYYDLAVTVFDPCDRYVTLDTPEVWPFPGHSDSTFVMPHRVYVRATADIPPHRELLIKYGRKNGAGDIVP
jgi:hypothetical protein